MPRRGRRIVGLRVCALLLLVTTACSSDPAGAPDTRDSPPRSPTGTSSGTSPGSSPGSSTGSATATPPTCPRSALAAPTCGVLWGVATQTPSLASVQDLEARVGRRFDLVYRFHRLGDELPTADEQAIVASGRLLHVSIDSGALPTGDGTTVWGGIAAGGQDDALQRAAEGVASLDGPVFVTFEHEANQPGKAALGSPEEFAAAWRHVHDVFSAAGADNAVWVWVMMGAPETLPGVARFWPGNGYVDWISWDVYNQSGCLAGAIDPSRYESFAAGALPFYRWVHTEGAAQGVGAAKPMMISEAGSVAYPDASGLTAQWYGEIPGLLAQYPQIKAVGLWDHTGNGLCDYRFDDQPAVLHAVARAGTDPRVAGTAQ